MTALERASSNCKQQTHTLVREDAPYQQTPRCLPVIKIWSWAPVGAWHQDRLADWPLVITKLWLLVQLRSQSKIDSWSWRLAVGSRSSLGNSSWRKYQLNPVVRGWDWHEMVATLQGCGPRSTGTSSIGNCYLCWESNSGRPVHSPSQYQLSCSCS
jgi:hypothetical protein